jgi:uncharacterized DUF497 family protein
MEEDTRFPYPERRLVTVGFIGNRLHIICHTPIDDGVRGHQFAQGQRTRGSQV